MIILIIFVRVIVARRRQERMKIVIIKIITSVMISKLILSHRHDNTDHALRDRSRVIVSLVMVTTHYYYVIK